MLLKAKPRNFFFSKFRQSEVVVKQTLCRLVSHLSARSLTPAGAEAQKASHACRAKAAAAMEREREGEKEEERERGEKKR